MIMTKKKCENLVQRPNITNDSQKAVLEYFQSKLQDQRLKKYPEWDVARGNPGAELVKSFRELYQAENELSEKRMESKKMNSAMTGEWSELRRKEELLRESLIKFNKFVKENDEKRERAERKIFEEKKQQAKCEAQIREIVDELNYVTNVRDNMRRYVREYAIYENYLNSVVNATSGEFQNIADIFNRYESLIESRNILALHQDQNFETLEVTGIEMQRMTEDKDQTLVDLNNKLQALQGRYDRAKASSLKWQDIVSRIKATAATKNLELTRVKFSCWNMYRQLCHRKGIPMEVDKDDIENQLAHIKRTIVELKRIAITARKKAATRMLGV